VITGYNTDVEYQGVVYHVQTEDKGLQTPIILSLVYVGGAILASKRAPYDDLITAGFDKQVLAERLQRQHKLICAAVHAGRIEELKRMGEREAAPAAVPEPQPLEEPQPAEKPYAQIAETIPTPVEAEPTPVAEPEQYVSDVPLDIRLIDEPEFRGGSSVVLKALVTRAAINGRTPATKVKVVVKTLSTSFSPNKVEALTDDAGVATVSLTFPRFRGGRAAVLVQVEDQALRAELRRIIVPSG
jgi:hypothetical protein